jgi:hypothetical protein
MAKEKIKSETKEFQAEVKKLLDIVITRYCHPFALHGAGYLCA